MKGRIQVFLALVALPALLLAAGCGPQGGDYPTKQVDLVVGGPPGGATDVVGRLLADHVAKKWSQPVNVLNKAGAGGATAGAELTQTKPDGYTVAMHPVSTGATIPAVQADLPYKWDQFTFIGMVNTNPAVFIVNGDSKWKTLKEVVEDVKKDPEKFKWGTAGPSGTSLFGIAQILEQGGVDPSRVTRVVFTGGAPTVQAVAGGHVDFAAQNLSEVVELIRAGKMRGLAVTGDARLSLLPEVPTGKEAGFDKFTFQGWNGVVGPPKLPKNVVDRWDAALKESLADKGFTDLLERAGATPLYLGPDAYKARVQKDYEYAVATAQRLKLTQ